MFTHSLSLSLTHSLILSLSHSFPLSLSLSHSLTLSLSLSLSMNNSDINSSAILNTVLIRALFLTGNLPSSTCNRCLAKKTDYCVCRQTEDSK